MSRISVGKSRKLSVCRSLDCRCTHDVGYGFVSNGTAEVGYRTVHSGCQRKDELEETCLQTLSARSVIVHSLLWFLCCVGDWGKAAADNGRIDLSRRRRTNSILEHSNDCDDWGVNGVMQVVVVARDKGLRKLDVTIRHDVVSPQVTLQQPLVCQLTYEDGEVHSTCQNPTHPLTTTCHDLPVRCRNR
jgi:hypothetical protein